MVGETMIVFLNGYCLIGKPAWKILNVKLKFQDDYSRDNVVIIQEEDNWK